MIRISSCSSTFCVASYISLTEPPAQYSMIICPPPKHTKSTLRTQPSPSHLKHTVTQLDITHPQLLLEQVAAKIADYKVAREQLEELDFLLERGEVLLCWEDLDGHLAHRVLLLRLVHRAIRSDQRAVKIAALFARDSKRETKQRLTPRPAIRPVRTSRSGQK